MSDNVHGVHCVEDIRLLIKKHHLEQGSDSQNRKMLIEGIETIKNRIMLNELLDSGLDVSKMGGWFSNFVRDKLGGSMEGTNIVWDVNDKKFILEPLSGKITCESQNS